MKKYNLKKIIDIIDSSYKVIGKTENILITNVKPINEADKESLVWVNPDRADKQKLVSNTKAKLILTNSSIDFTEKLLNEKCFIIVSNPKITYIKLISIFYAKKIEYGIHPTAYIHPEAQIHPKTYIGPFTYVGKAFIKEKTIIDGHVYIYDNVKIGKNVHIQAGCIIGAEGLNITKNENGDWVQFPHIGGVNIEDNVNIDVMNLVNRP